MISSDTAESNLLAGAAIQQRKIDADHSPMFDEAVPALLFVHF
jgi:hypothetical protein